MHTLRDIAQLIKAELFGDPTAEIIRTRPFEAAEPGDITYAANPSYRGRLDDCRATAVIISPPAETSSRNLLVAANPKLAFARAIQALHGTVYTAQGVSPDLITGVGTVLGRQLSILARVTIGRDCEIGDRVSLYPGVVIGDRCRIGDDSVIHSNVSVYDDTRIGSRVIIHAGAVIGADGFAFVPGEDGRQVKVLQLGRVRIEDDCEIGANCAIDRAAFGETLLKGGVKLDNLIQVGHNSEIGEHTVVAALTGFSGGARVGRRCVIAGQVGTNQHITIGDGAIVAGQAGVTKNVRAGAMMAGTPAQELNSWRRSQVLYSRLPRLADRIARLEIAAGLREKK